VRACESPSPWAMVTDLLDSSTDTASGVWGDLMLVYSADGVGSLAFFCAGFV